MRSWCVFGAVCIVSTWLTARSCDAQGIEPILEAPSVDQRVDRLESQLRRIEDLLLQMTGGTPAESSTSDQPAVPRQGFESPSDRPQPMEPAQPTEAEATLAETQGQKLDTLTVRVQALEDKLEQLTKQDGDQLIPDFAAMATSPTLRQDLFRAINGRFEVHNNLRDWMSVRLNGQQWRFPPGVSSIRIPYGYVQAELVQGGDRYDFQAGDWKMESDELVLRMGITDQLPQQE